MRNDTHLEAHHVSPTRPLSADIPWMAAFAAMMVFLVFALAGWVK